MPRSIWKGIFLRLLGGSVGRLIQSAAAMTAEEYISSLYRLCLGRDPEAAGLAPWLKLIRRTGDPTCVLAGILASAEYKARIASAAPNDCSLEARKALGVLGRRPRVVDVGAQSLGAGTHPYSPLAALSPLDIVGFDPLVDRLSQRAETEEAEGLTLLPYAVGDGGTHTLHINNFDATSSLFPLNEPHNASFNHLCDLRTVRTESVRTHRLDDVLPEGPVDFLKLDVQGAELMVLRGAEHTLARTAVVHCEVEFSPIYAGQPLYPEIHECLAARGFVLIDFVTSVRYHYIVPSCRTAPDHLLWADAVFFRQAEERQVLVAQALIAAAVYRKPTLAEYLLARIGITT